MTPDQFENLITLLPRIANRPGMYFPKDAPAVEVFVRGFVGGVGIFIDFEQYRAHNRHTNAVRSLRPNVSPYTQFRERGMSDGAAIYEYLTMIIESFQALDPATHQPEAITAEHHETLMIFLQAVRERPRMYFSDAGHAIDNFVSGFTLGVSIFVDREKLGEAQRKTLEKWQLAPNRSPYTQFRERGMSEKEAIEAYLAVLVEDYLPLEP